MNVQRTDDQMEDARRVAWGFNCEQTAIATYRCSDLQIQTGRYRRNIVLCPLLQREE